MNTKLLGASLAAVFAVSMISAAVADEIPGYLTIKNSQVIQNDQIAVLKVSVDGNINDGIDPDTGDGFYGYAALTDDFQGMLAATYHEPIVDSSEQPGWHSHIVDAGPSTKCDSGIQVNAASYDPAGHTIAAGQNIVVNQANSSELGQLNGAVLAFGLTVEDGKVCINPVG